MVAFLWRAAAAFRLFVNICSYFIYYYSKNQKKNDILKVKNSIIQTIVFFNVVRLLYFFRKRGPQISPFLRIFAY